MSTPSYTPPGSAQRGAFEYDYDDARGQGLVTFAGVLITIAGVLNVLYGIAAVRHARYFAQHQHYIFGNLKTWGWFVIILGVVQLFAAAAVWRGASWGRWFGVASVSINMILQTLWLPAAPLLSIIILTLDLVALYGLLSYGGRREQYKEQQARAAAAH